LASVAEAKLFLSISNRELREDRERWEEVAGVASGQQDGLYPRH
jgi:hypothetical protein